MDHEAVRAARSPTPPKVSKTAAGWHSGQCSDLSDGDDSADEEAAMLAANDEHPKKKRKGDGRSERAKRMDPVNKGQKTQIEALSRTTDATAPHVVELNGPCWTNEHDREPVKATLACLFAAVQCGKTKDGNPIMEIVDAIAVQGTSKSKPATQSVPAKHFKCPDTAKGSLSRYAKCVKPLDECRDGTLLFGPGCRIPRVASTALFPGESMNALSVYRFDKGGFLYPKEGVAMLTEIDEDALVWISSGTKANDEFVAAAGVEVLGMVKDAISRDGIGAEFFYFTGSTNGTQVAPVFEPALKFIKGVVASTQTMAVLNEVVQTHETMPTAAVATSEMPTAYPLIHQVATKLAVDKSVPVAVGELMALLDGETFPRADSLPAVVKHATNRTEEHAAHVRETLQIMSSKIDESPIYRCDAFYCKAKEYFDALIMGTTMTLTPIVDFLLDKLFNIVNSLGVFVAFTRAKDEVKRLKAEKLEALKDREEDEGHIADMAALPAPPDTPLSTIGAKLSEWLETGAAGKPETVEYITSFIQSKCGDTRNGLVEATMKFGDGAVDAEFHAFADGLCQLFERQGWIGTAFTPIEAELTRAYMRHGGKSRYGCLRARLVSQLMEPFIKARAIAEEQALQAELQAATATMAKAEVSYTQRRSTRRRKATKRLVAEEDDNEHAKRARTSPQASH
jgi:hypothetical protein